MSRCDWNKEVFSTPCPVAALCEDGSCSVLGAKHDIASRCIRRRQTCRTESVSPSSLGRLSQKSIKHDHRECATTRDPPRGVRTTDSDCVSSSSLGWLGHLQAQLRKVSQKCTSPIPISKPLSADLPGLCGKKFGVRRLCRTRRTGRTSRIAD